MDDEQQPIYSNEQIQSYVEKQNKNKMFKEPKIVMIVILIRFNVRFVDLDLLARKTLTAHYEKRRFAACILRHDKTQYAGLVFASGTMIISFGDLDLRKELEDFFLEKLHVIDQTIQYESSEIVNTTLSCGLKPDYGIYLNKLNCQDGAKFSSELFPGLCYNNKKKNADANTNIKLVVFGSGKFNITGCKNLLQMKESYQLAIEQVMKFIKIKNKRI